MNNPLVSAFRIRLATTMLEPAAKLPKGKCTTLVNPDGTIVFFGHEPKGQVEKKILALQRRLAQRGIELVAFDLSRDGRAWAVVAVTALPGNGARVLERELDQFLRDFWPKALRHWRRRQRSRSSEPHRRSDHGRGTETPAAS